MKDWLRSWAPPIALMAWMLLSLRFAAFYTVTIYILGFVVVCGIVMALKRGAEAEERLRRYEEERPL